MSTPVSVDAVILAAGLSTRMEKPKALLEIGPETFLERAIHVLKGGGCRTIVAVLNDLDDRAQQLAEASGAAVVINDQPDSQQLDSLRVGMRALPEDWAGVTVLPVDVPLVSTDTVQALLHAFAERRAAITVPFHNGVAGHPVLLSRALEQDVLERHWDEGVRSLIMQHARDLCEVKVMDPGVLIDVDTPEDYWRYVKDRTR